MNKPSENTVIWYAVDRTSPSYTKKADVDGQKITSINATYMAREATELFGPAGIGWGVKVLEERFDSGAPAMNDAGDILGHEIMHTIRLQLWYLHNGERGEVEHYGHTPYIRKTKYGLRTDFDAPKKSMTDATKKCLSMLGFCADIYMGMYDDSQYVAAALAEEKLEKADSQDEKAVETKLEFGKWCEDEIKTYATLKTPGAVHTMHKVLEAKARRRANAVGLNPDKIADRFTAARDARIDALTPKKKEETA
jgi:hypothetical protein